MTVIVNNGYLGMVNQWQSMFFEERRSHVHLTHAVPDYAALAEAYGAVGLHRLRRRRPRGGAGRGALVRPNRRRRRRVDAHEQCFPMIPAGAAALDMLEYDEPET